MPDAAALQCLVPTDCPATLTCNANHTCTPIPPSTTGLLAYWPFDTPSQWPDDVGGNNATCVAGQCPATIPGAIGNAASFDGTTSCLSVASLGSWVNPTFTFAAWVQGAALAGPIVVHEEAVPGCPSPELGAKNGIGVIENNTTGVHNQAWSSAIANPASWHHVAATWDGSEQRVFVDGECVCSTAPQHPPAFNGTQPFTIGCYPTASPAERFTGGIDEVRVYSRALANDEVANLYEAGGFAPPASLVCPQTPCAAAPP
jgi:hypothetical protein